jgi:hypothetical protein
MYDCNVINLLKEPHDQKLMDFIPGYLLLPDNIRTNARHHRVFLPTLFDTIEDGMRDIIRILPDIIMILPGRFRMMAPISPRIVAFKVGRYSR